MRQGNSVLDGDFHCAKELGMSIQQWKYCWASLWRQLFFFFFCSPCVKVNGSSLSRSKFSSRPRRVWFVGVTPDPSSSALVFFWQFNWNADRDKKKTWSFVGWEGTRWIFSDGKFFGVTQPKIFTCSLVRQRVSWTLSADSKRVSFQIQAVLTRKKQHFSILCS